MTTVDLDPQQQQELLEIILKTSPGKSRSSALKLVNLNKIKKQWSAFLRLVEQYAPSGLKGPVLDFGCGKGNFLFYGLSRGHDLWGLEVRKKDRMIFRERIRLSQAPDWWQQRLLLYDGRYFPFDNDYFTIMRSHYVLEHVPDLNLAIREMVRVTRPGGLLVLEAEDARIPFEAHLNIPWLPFMPAEWIGAWLEEFDKLSRMDELKEVYAITAPQAAAVLQSFGCRILLKNGDPPPFIPGHRQMRSLDEVREKARWARNLFEQGKWPRDRCGLMIVAVKDTDEARLPAG